MTQEQFLSWLKTTLGFVAGVAVAKGYISDQGATAIIGAVIAVVPLVWGFIANTKLAQIKTTAALPEVSSVVIKPSATNGIAAAAADPLQPKIVKSTSTNVAR
jgi:hypothetical protein